VSETLAQRLMVLYAAAKARRTGPWFEGRVDLLQRNVCHMRLLLLRHSDATQGLCRYGASTALRWLADIQRAKSGPLCAHRQQRVFTAHGGVRARFRSTTH